MKNILKKTIYVVMVFLSITVILEILFLSFLQKTNSKIASIVQTTTKSVFTKYAPYILSINLAGAKYNALLLTAKTQLEYQGRVGRLGFLDNDETLWIELRDITDNNIQGIYLGMSTKSLVIKNKEGKKIGIEKVENGDKIKVSLLYDYKQTLVNAIIERL